MYLTIIPYFSLSYFSYTLWNKTSLSYALFVPIGGLIPSSACATFMIVNSYPWYYHVLTTLILFTSTIGSLVILIFIVFFTMCCENTSGKLPEF